MPLECDLTSSVFERIWAECWPCQARRESIDAASGLPLLIQDASNVSNEHVHINVTTNLLAAPYSQDVAQIYSARNATIHVYEKIQMDQTGFFRQTALPFDQLPLRLIPTGQVVPQYFDSLIAKNEGDCQRLYQLGLAISNNKEVLLPLAFETWLQYFVRQRGIRPGATEQFLYDYYDAWATSPSTLRSFVPFMPFAGRRPVIAKRIISSSRVIYTVPFPQYASPNYSGSQPGLMTMFRRAYYDQTVIRNLAPGSPVDICTLSEFQKISQAMRRRYPHQRWYSFDGDLVIPQSWLTKRLPEATSPQYPMRREMEFWWYSRYVWTYYHAPGFRGVLPYETRLRFAQRQACYRYGGDVTQDDQDGLDFEYTCWLQDIDNLGIYPFDEEGNSAAQLARWYRTTQWTDRNALGNGPGS